MGKIDFSICESTGSWFIQSHSVPQDIAIKSDLEIVNYAIEKSFFDDEYFHIGVYWNDPSVKA